LYNKYIVIITAENKERYVSETINSCLKNSNNKKTRIFVTYSNLSNEKYLKVKFKRYKNIIFLKIHIKKKYPTQDQLYKIEQTLKFAKNEWVLLLDGDDYFINNKIKVLNKLNLKKNLVYLHDHKIKIGKTLLNPKFKKYKNFYLYQMLFNEWPQNINTSSIIINTNLIKNFYKNYNPYKWKYLAIDTQIILYFYYKKKFKQLNHIFTIKLENINNLDKTFSNMRTKKYWMRRKEQHELTRHLSGKKNFFDRILTNIFLKFFK
tara:strand:+ start:749 stop:1537 length:789 start_codon:yes stop_codon:yes gene_type:complete